MLIDSVAFEINTDINVVDGCFADTATDRIYEGKENALVWDNNNLDETHLGESYFAKKNIET